MSTSRWSGERPNDRLTGTRDDVRGLQLADPELFFPVGTTGPALRQIREAKRICRGCPAQAPCLAWALDHGVAAGIWGGATEDERRAMRRALISDRSET